MSIVGVILLLGALFVGYNMLKDKKGSTAVSKDTSQSETSTTQETYPVTYSDNQATSITLVVNKKHKLPQSYAPSTVNIYGGSLRSEASTALTSLFKAANSKGYTTKLVSGYRSYDRQEQVYNDYVAKDGQAQADTYSARPGFSEHQTGLAADVDDGSGCSLQICFAETALGKWLVSNASSYGFIIRYEKGKESITGYQYEPWHLRYVGTDVAKKIVASGKTMDEYYGVVGGDYAN